MVLVRCDRCDLALRSVAVKLFGEEYSAKQCPKCGTRVINLDLALKMHERLLPRLSCEKRIIKIGDSSAVTIPREIRRFFLPGSAVKMDFDPHEMEIRIRKG